MRRRGRQVFFLPSCPLDTIVAFVEYGMDSEGEWPLLERLRVQVGVGSTKGVRYFWSPRPRPPISPALKYHSPSHGTGVTSCAMGTSPLGGQFSGRSVLCSVPVVRYLTSDRKRDFDGVIKSRRDGRFDCNGGSDGRESEPGGEHREQEDTTEEQEEAKSRANPTSSHTASSSCF